VSKSDSSQQSLQDAFPQEVVVTNLITQEVLQ